MAFNHDEFKEWLKTCRDLDLLEAVKADVKRRVSFLEHQAQWQRALEIEAYVRPGQSLLVTTEKGLRRAVLIRVRAARVDVCFRNHTEVETVRPSEVVFDTAAILQAEAEKKAADAAKSEAA